MKILKIELQNINSLKSDIPIVIDFDNEQFKDVGLYAITGSTGAGKTTILDAITIALYHNVPRFNGSKGTLLDVVSHGAYDAFSRVTFKNDNNIYEAFWGIRIADKNGKAYKNPKEEVSLKNLTTDAILATQKRNLITEIVAVTQLDYNQFLRSVMLAQGEFASFLTAKGPEKGKLLEQITGEQIYKKIGQGILDRKSKEENTLKEIESKINADDVLTEDAKVELKQQDKFLDTEIIKTEKDLTTTQVIVNWYVQYRELVVKSDTLEQNTKTLDVFIEKHKPELDLLALNEKAEPFKEITQNLNRTEKETIAKENQLKTIEKELTTLKPQIVNLETITKNEDAEIVLSEKEFSAWSTKFDVVTKIDSELESEKETKQNESKKLTELNLQIEALKVNQHKLNKDLGETTSKIKVDEIFISENKFLKEVTLEISDWTTGLTTLKGHKEILNASVLSVKEKKAAISNTTEILKINNELLLKRVADVTKIDKEIETINLAIEKNNLTNLLAKKDKLLIAESNWKQFKAFADQHKKAADTKATLLENKKSYTLDLEVIRKQIAGLKKDIEIQEKAVTDASKILDLEKSVAKYETDRQYLITGEPCGLCGSKEHPFTEHVTEINISKSELELHNRKEKLQLLINSKTALDKNEVQLNTNIDSLTKQLNTLISELNVIETNVKQLNISCELNNISKINIELNTIITQLKDLNSNVTVAQQLQVDKDKLSKNIEVEKQEVQTLKTTVATLVEKNKNAKVDIDQSEKTIDKVSKVCTDLETDLKTKLSRFTYQVPSTENTNSFIKKIEEKISTFNKTQKNLDTLGAEIKVIDTKLDNDKKQLETFSKKQTESSKTISDSGIKYEQLKTQRIAILPIDITVESKRNSLQALRNKLNDKAKLSKIGLQKLLDAKNRQEALKLENNKSQRELTNLLNTLKASLELQLKDSNFNSKQAIESALLSAEEKAKFTTNKERIRENELKIKTLKEENIKAKEDLNKSKTFETSEIESKQNLDSLKTKKDGFLTEKGKIFQAFKKDKEIRDRNTEVYKKIDAQAEICKVWKELFKITGNSKDAFNVYVQRLTLRHLLDLANVHLYKLNKRYSLKMEESYKPKEELNFNLIDHYQTDQARLVDTSSGGEKFIISLALALGLSDLASKNVKIDSLFIDEGFGTLDSNTLETVISTLETLQSQGKMIGIISHVENLKERIPTQIQITKKSNGVSTVEII
ncbi:AAA family ATPase [Polaribacter sp. PL03]|uniref:AAA family ATPase n=1 Tax=Polaribacter sp. PL03 TaxID=3088353 RepID=UPI0029D19829|nr:AAA family ATPase [Polaribacter sp. PL03]MDX6747289.1 AAA family ATPase [Polaribacter sp. PL03]